MAGLDNSGLENIEHSVLVQLIPNVVEKVIFPKIASINILIILYYPTPNKFFFCRINLILIDFLIN